MSCSHAFDIIDRSKENVKIINLVTGTCHVPKRPIVMRQRDNEKSFLLIVTLSFKPGSYFGSMNK